MDGVKRHSKNQIEYITYDAFEEYAGISTLTTIRMPVVDELKSSDPARILDVLGPGLASILEVPFENFIAANQAHLSEIFLVKGDLIKRLGSPEYFIKSSTDGFLTDLKRVPLVVFTADCLPIFLYDISKHVVGLIHAGKKGTKAGITASAVYRLVDSYGSDPADVVALIGASIGPCCYSVDLWSENIRRLEQQGVGKLVNPRVCTGCNTDKFYSYRVEKGISGRMVSLIMLR